MEGRPSTSVPESVPGPQGREPQGEPATRSYVLTEHTRNDLERRFTYHPLREDQPDRYTAIRDRAKDLAIKIVELTPYTREQSVALTKLEEVVMWANAAIARNE